MPSTVAGDFYGSPVQADQASIPRKYVRTTDATTAYWREEVQTVSTAGSSTAVTAAQGTGSSVSPWFVAPLTTDSLVRVQDLTTASKVRIESSAALAISGNTTVSPAAGSTFLVRSVAQSVGEFTLETGTTAHSTYASKISSVAGTTSLVSSGAGRVRVLSVAIQQTDTASTVSQLVQFLSSATAIGGAPEWLLSQREGVVQTAPAGAYLFQTSTGEALQITLSTNVKTMVHVVAVRTT